jgi:hypothetical protein
VAEAETEPLIGLSRSAWKPVTQNYGLNWLCPARAFPFRQGPVRRLTALKQEGSERVAVDLRC